MKRIEEIIEAVKKYSPKADVTLISRAYVFSARVHKDQLRSSGKPYLSHPLEVAYTLTRLKLDPVAIAVGLLHDTLEDTYATEEAIERTFGKKVLSLVRGLTKISKIEFKNREESDAENFRKMILAMTKDIRVILVKLADRVHNIQTLQYVSRERQVRIARETLEIYAPLANRLGAGWIKRDLEEFSFKFLYPKDYATIEKDVAISFEERTSYISDFSDIVDKELGKNGISFTSVGRPKHYYSIYKKMERQGISFAEVYDTIGIRIITDSVRNCYSILGIIHSLWKPIPGKMKDYIAMPKSNMYQSIHTTVLGPKGYRVELQIRTYEMHSVCEQGIAAHWKYKEEGEIDKDQKQFLWLRQLLEWHQELKDPKEFLDTVKVDLFPEEVYVFTPQGDVKGLPRGARPIDFAYHIHTDIGDHCIGAKVSGRIVPLRYELQNGDIVEILTSSSQTPHRDWLTFVKTSKARTKIRSWLTNEQRKKSQALGKELLQSELLRHNIKFSKLAKSAEFKKVVSGFGFTSGKKLLESLGFGKTSLSAVVNKILPPEAIAEIKSLEEEKTKKVTDRKRQKKAHEPNIKVKGLDDILVRFCRCCNPIPGDLITGFITRGRGVSIHDAGCPNVDLNIDSDRQVAVEWDHSDKITRLVAISIDSENRVGLLASISNAISSCKSNITRADICTPATGPARLKFSIEVSNLEHLKQVLAKVEAVKGVLKAKREKSGENQGYAWKKTA